MERIKNCFQKNLFTFSHLAAALITCVEVRPHVLMGSDDHRSSQSSSLPDCRMQGVMESRDRVSTTPAKSERPSAGPVGKTGNGTGRLTTILHPLTLEEARLIASCGNQRRRPASGGVDRYPPESGQIQAMVQPVSNDRHTAATARFPAPAAGTTMPSSRRQTCRCFDYWLRSR